MADFTEFLNRIQQLEENVIMPISAGGPAGESLKDFDPNIFNTSVFDGSQFPTMTETMTTSIFHAPSIQTSSDLSVYLGALSPKEGVNVESRPRRSFPVIPGVPIPFFKDMIADAAPPLPAFESFAEITVAPGSTPGLAQALSAIEAGGTIKLLPGIYEGSYIIRHDVQLKAAGDVFFDSPSTSLFIENGLVSIEGVAFRTGTVEVSGTTRVQFTSTRFSSMLLVKGEAVVSCRDTFFAVQNEHSVRVDENGSLTLIECTIESRGINLKKGNVSVLKTRVESVQGSCLEIEGGVAYFEESSLGDCTNNVVKCINKSIVTLTNCNFYDSERENLITASRGAIVKVKGGKFSGRCNASIVSSNGAAVSVEDCDLAKPVISNNDALLRLKRCKPVIVFVSSSRLILSECHIIAAPRTGLVSIGVSDLQVEHCIFSSCTTNGMELSDDTTATIVGSQFIQNQVAGAVISSNSATLRDCIFDGNNLVGCQVSGHYASPLFDNCTFTNNSVAGATTLENTSPSFIGCQFKQNDKYGVVVAKSAPSFVNSEFSINQGIGVEVKGGAAPKLDNCVFDSNANFAAQISGQGTNVSFSQCSFNRHANSSSVIVYAKAISLFNQCLFSQSGSCHAEIREEAKGRFEQCVLSESAGGIGLFVHNSGVLEVDNSSLKDEAKTAIFVGNRGQAAIVGSEITGCQCCGIITDLQSSAVIMRNVIRSNGAAGVQVEGGEVRIEGNTIEGHTDFGIYSTNVSQVTQESNTFAQNGKGDTQIA